jgi:hypothetical protein
MEDDYLKILICCQFFNGYTGSEVSNFELASELVRLGHDVSIVSEQVGDPLLSKARRNGIKVYDINERLFYSAKAVFDILHINHKPIGEKLLTLYRNIPAVMHVRSEVIPVFEEPIISDQIKKYISIRESITDYITTFGIDRKDIVPIDNPFDHKRFNTNYKKKDNKEKVTLFVGSLDHLRRNILFHTCERIKKEGGKLWIIGKNTGGYADQLLKYPFVKFYGQQSNVETYIKKADYTVGIFRGRTTIEGWLCGVPAYIYEVDKQGNITSENFVQVPDDVEKYRADNSVELVEDLYYDVLEEIDNG